MHVELAVPGLLPAKDAGRHPALELLLVRARRRDDEALSPEAWLAGAFGLGTAPLPAGALTLLAGAGAEGGEGSMRADPVHLRLLRDRIAVVPAEAFELSHEEAEALAAALNAHFAGRVAFQVHDARRWTARAAVPVEMRIEPALAQAGRELRGGDALVNEIQMLLHAHPVNASREERGEPVVNSVWLWGAGAPPAVEADWHSVLADDPVPLGLARQARARHGALPATAADWLERAPEEGRHLVWLDALRAPAQLDDTEAFRERLARLESAWFAPLVTALRAGRVGMVTLHAPEAGAVFEAARGDLRRFWRRPRPLAELA